VIILRLFPGFLTNGVAEIHKLRLNEVDAEHLPEEDHNKYLSLLANRQKELASAFREHMTKDQTYDTPNDYRNDFYTEVINEAEKVNFLFFPVSVRITVFSSSWIGANKSK
jgi:hypothetical protein